MRALVAVTILVSFALVVPVESYGAWPGLQGFQMTARAEGGAQNLLAGSHPYSLTARVGLGASSEGQPQLLAPEEDLRSLRLELPAGLILNSTALSQCSSAAFAAARASPFEASQSGEDCPEASQVGTVDVYSGTTGTVRRFGVFNLAPVRGSPGRLGIAPFGAHVIMGIGIQADPANQYRLVLDAADFPRYLRVQALELALWGVPWGASHDGERGDCLNEADPGFPWAKCSVGPPVNNRPLAYLTMPTDCGSPQAFVATAASWQQQIPASARYPAGGVSFLGGCDGLGFNPMPLAQLTERRTSSSSGFSFDLINEAEQLTMPDLRLPSQVRTARVFLPEGVTLNPSMGSGLGVCTPSQYAAETTSSLGCPEESKIGNFTVRTPLFEEAITGAVYLAEPDDPSTAPPGAENPFDSLLALYFVARSSQRGILLKVPGKLDADPDTGRLTATLENLPQLPYTHLEAHFKTGQRAPLITPSHCGTVVTRVEMLPWAQGPKPVVSSTSAPIQEGIGGGPCPGGGAPPFAPTAVAGSLNSNVGSYTPFYLRLTRTDAEQEITSYSAVLPRGLTGRLAGIPTCSDTAIAAARTRTGREEQAHPTCPATSQVGHTYSGYGVGRALAYAPGKVYLAGAYHGSPLSLVTINAATVGPFDLGTVVIRSALEVDPRTAQLRIDSRASDPIPHILKGVPLHLRDVRVYLDRPDFTRNPTSCEPSQVISTLTGSGARFGDSSDDSTATVANHFQLLNCRTLGFRPRLGLRLRGRTRRGDFPALRAVFAARPGDANLKRIAVTMPHSEFLAQSHIRAICTRVQFAAESCPRGSIYGRAVVYTPLLDQPLSGPVYLRSSSNPLPDMVTSLRSGSVRLVLEGRIGPARHGIRIFFDDLPDAPLARFVLQMKGGRRGLLVNSANICASPPVATVKALGQNNLGRIFTTKLRGKCGARQRGRGR